MKNLMHTCQLDLLPTVVFTAIIMLSAIIRSSLTTGTVPAPFIMLKSRQFVIYILCFMPLLFL